eukprot:scaffold7961_cov73-Skeletonema_dohrnii-CCMP3373.AAC.1
MANYHQRRTIVCLSTLFCIFATTSSTKLRHPSSSSRHLQAASDPNTQFCGRTWGDAIADCSPSTHCPNGNDDCDSTETCHSSLPGCNINDMSAQQQPQPSGNGGATAPAGAPTPPPIRNEYDERNMKFCGPSWNEANDSCTLKTWCPMGNECDANSGQICWGGVANCNAFKLLELEDAPGVNNNGNNNGGGVGGADTVEVEPPPQQQQQQCSAEVYQCKSGSFVARAPELNCAFYPCPVLPLIETNAPTTNKAPTYVPTYAPTMAMVVVPDPVTVAPTLQPTVWVDNDENDTNNNNNE